MWVVFILHRLKCVEDCEVVLDAIVVVHLHWQDQHSVTCPHLKWVLATINDRNQTTLSISLVILVLNVTNLSIHPFYWLLSFVCVYVGCNVSKIKCKRCHKRKQKYNLKI